MLCRAFDFCADRRACLALHQNHDCPQSACEGLVEANPRNGSSIVYWTYI